MPFAHLVTDALFSTFHAIGNAIQTLPPFFTIGMGIIIFIVIIGATGNE
jgi:hypothetical protein